MESMEVHGMHTGNWKEIGFHGIHGSGIDFHGSGIYGVLPPSKRCVQTVHLNCAWIFSEFHDLGWISMDLDWIFHGFSMDFS